jgi:hypothetical protein
MTRIDIGPGLGLGGTGAGQVDHTLSKFLVRVPIILCCDVLNMGNTRIPGSIDGEIVSAPLPAT